MKVLLTAQWVIGFVDGFREDFPQVELVFAETAEDIAAKAADAEAAIGPDEQQPAAGRAQPALDTVVQRRRGVDAQRAGAGGAGYYRL